MPEHESQPAACTGDAGPLLFVSFVIPVRNDAIRLRNCLASIRGNQYPADRLEIIVADNGSLDDSADQARQAGAQVLELPGLRVAELRNRGVAAARGDVIAFVDADHEIVPGWIAGAVEALTRPGVAAAGAAYLPPSPGTWVQQTYDLLRQHPQGQAETTWLPGGNLAIQRHCFEQIGGFDARLEACEDVDLCQRLQQAGWKLLADDRMQSVHHGDPRTIRELFMAELWRGRNNYQVSFRKPWSFRNVVSALLPLAGLLALALVVAGLAAVPFAGPGWFLTGLAILAGLTSLRAVQMLRNGGWTGWHHLHRIVAVGITYDLARSLALVSRFPSRRRQQPEKP